MAFKEEGEVNYTIINGKKVPVVKCETEVVLRNTQTNYEYNSDKEAEDDIANPETDTQQEHIRHVDQSRDPSRSQVMVHRILDFVCIPPNSPSLKQNIIYR